MFCFLIRCVDTETLYIERPLHLDVTEGLVSAPSTFTETQSPVASALMSHMPSPA